MTDARQDVAALIVTYHADLDRLRAQLAALKPQVEHLVILDNSTRAAALVDIETLAAEFTAEYRSMGGNVGIAAAQNAGIRWARERDVRFVLLMDQDSLPAQDMVAQLKRGMTQASAAGVAMAAVGPLTQDRRGRQTTLLFSDRFWGPRRIRTTIGPGQLLDVVFLLASGCLIDSRVLDLVGPMREDLFIDHVDLEWCLRARRAGYALRGVTDAVLGHELGDQVIEVRFPQRRTVHIHSPLRNYYLIRNTLLLMRGDLFPLRWKIGYAVWLMKFIVFNVLFAAPRLARVGPIAAAILDAARNRAGPMRRTG